ncbi:MAG: indolepyruvate ferredoxin oxidoreductase subunit alpha [Promethearchaeota archaeon]
MNIQDIDLESISTHVGDTGDFISINNERCNNCGNCLTICIKNLWKKKDGKIYIVDDYKSRCIECGSCAQVCEAGAIDFNFPAGGTGVVYEKG